MAAFMSGIGLPELLVVLVILLLIFGAKRLPEVARSLGRSSREFRRGVEGDADEGQPATGPEGKQGNRSDASTKRAG